MSWVNFSFLGEVGSNVVGEGGGAYFPFYEFVDVVVVVFCPFLLRVLGAPDVVFVA